MKYTTTKCPHCGYQTRSHESRLPQVQIGSPLMLCPKCRHLILDNIAKEYEFMTEKERQGFTTQAAQQKSYGGNLLFIVFGVLFFIAGIITGALYLAEGNISGIGMISSGIIIGCGSIALSIYQMKHNRELANEEFIEQCVYESLQRTSKKAYVDLLQNAYQTFKIKRTFLPFEGKENFLRAYKKFETRESYQNSMREFENILNALNESAKVEKTNTTSFWLH